MSTIRIGIAGCDRLRRPGVAAPRGAPLRGRRHRRDELGDRGRHTEPAGADRDLGRTDRTVLDSTCWRIEPTSCFWACPTRSAPSSPRPCSRAAGASSICRGPFDSVTPVHAGGGTRPRPPSIDPRAYGLTEWNRDVLPDAGLVACPGCYPTGALLALKPLVEANLIAPDADVYVDAKSGVSGARQEAEPAHALLRGARQRRRLTASSLIATAPRWSRSCRAR